MYTINRFVLQELVILLGGSSDCEELVGVNHGRRWLGISGSREMHNSTIHHCFFRQLIHNCFQTIRSFIA